VPEAPAAGRHEVSKVAVDHPGVVREIGVITRAEQVMAPAGVEFLRLLRP